MGRGRGTVPRGMGAAVEAMVGVFGGRTMDGGLRDPGRGREVGVEVAIVVSEGMGLVWGGERKGLKRARRVLAELK